ncbi:hypothetical protein GP681_13750 [Escherichia coli]|nr:hypothetical protein GP681_13750 [Escherichia coli]
MLPSETMIWQPEFTDKTLSRKPGAVQLLDKIITIHRVIQVVTASLKLRDYDGQVAEAMPMIPKQRKPKCLKACVLPENMTGSGVRNRFNKANRYYKTRGTIYFVFR